MWNVPNYNGYNPANYMQAPMPQQPTQQGQTIKEITPTQPNIECYSVSSADDLKSINVLPGTVYIGLSKDNKFVYVRHFTDDGKIVQDTYTKAQVEQEKTDLQLIAEKLSSIENKLNKWELPDGTANS